MKSYHIAVALLAFAVALAPLTTNAQVQLQAGIRGGLNVMNLHGDDVEGTDSKTGIVVGGFLSIQTGEYLVIQPEFLYTQKGAKESFSGTENGIMITGDLKVKLEYFEIPVLLKLSLPTQTSVRPIFYAGPTVAFKLSSKAEIEATGTDGVNTVTISLEQDMEDIKSVDFGLTFGGGLGFAVGKGQLLLDGRYTLGLTSIDDTPFEYDVKNGGFSIMAGYSFPLGG